MLLNGEREPLLQTAVSWGSVAANTEKKISVTPPSVLPAEGKYLISVRNASTISALTGLVKGLEAYLATAGTYCELMRFSIGTAGNKPNQTLVQGWLVSEESGATAPGQILLKNDTAVNTSQKFAAKVQIRKY